MINYRALIAGSFVAMASISSASACSSGFIADTLCRAGVINKQQANAADRAHARMGRPLDHAANQAAGAAVNYFVPGAGPMVTRGLEMRDQFNRGGFPGMPSAGGFPPGQPGGVGGFQPPQMRPMQEAAMGNVCHTPYGSVAGHLSPMGSQCHIMGPSGPIMGMVGR